MIGWTIETLVATTLLMLLVLAIRAPVRKAFGPQIAYALWALPVIRMLMPPLPGQWQLTSLLAPLSRSAEVSPGVAMGVLNADALSQELADAAILQAKLELAGHGMNAAVVPPTMVSDGAPLGILILGLWALGTLAFLAYHLIAHSRFCSRLLSRARVDRMVAKGRVRVIETDAAHGPLAFGIWRKYVAFPRDFSERYDEVERDLALAHELGHHVRGDLIANWVALVVLAIHWFNPVAWRAFRAFRADQEMACDALVLHGRAQALRHAYGRAIVKSAHGGAVSAACHLHTINEVKGRLRMLSKNNSRSPARIAAGLAGVSALSLAALGLTASGTQAAERIADKVEATIGARLLPLKELTRIGAQDAPAAPETPAAQDAPAAPDAPDAPKVEKRRVVVIHGDGQVDKDGKTKKFVFRSTDGEEMNLNFDFADIQASIPEIKNAKCGKGDAKAPIVKHDSKDGKKQVIVICSDRIELMAANAERMAEIQVKMAERHKKFGMTTALASLKHARASVAAQTELEAAEKARALAGIDEAIAELEKEADKD